jgi:Methyltransferase domain
MVEFLELRGIQGATVLEVGGGVGEIQIELLKRGAARAVNLELSAAYEQEAKSLLREAGLEERAERRLHDIAVDPKGVEAADVVVLHRVVCCYPDYERLLGAAAQHARRLLVFSYPPRNAGSRLFIATQNLVFGLLRREFRTFAHPPTASSAFSGSAGSAAHSPITRSCGKWQASSASGSSSSSWLWAACVAAALCARRRPRRRARSGSR